MRSVKGYPRPCPSGHMTRLIRGKRVCRDNRPAHDGAQADEEHDCPVRAETPRCHLSHVGERDPHRRWSAVPAQLPGAFERVSPEHRMLKHKPLAVRARDADLGWLLRGENRLRPSSVCHP